MTFDLDDAARRSAHAWSRSSRRRCELPAIEASAAAVAALIERRLGSPPELVASAAGPHVHWRGDGEPRVLLVGHHDTVFPLGALAARPFTVADGRVTGPGVFDMKGGIVLGVHAVGVAGRPRRASSCCSRRDEEVGSGASRALIEERAARLRRRARARAGGRRRRRQDRPQGHRRVRGGRARPGRRTPGWSRRRASTRSSRRPTRCWRSSSSARPERGHDRDADGRQRRHGRQRRAGRGPHPRRRPGQRARRGRPAGGGDGRAQRRSTRQPGWRCSAASTARRCRSRRRPSCSRWPRRSPSTIGLPEPVGVAVGGGSDGNFTAALGIPTLDGLGVAGGGAHADHEYAETSTMVDRTRLLAGLVVRARSRGSIRVSAAGHPRS